MLRKTIVSFLVLWLSLQGMTAVAMPYCRHAGGEAQASQLEHACHQAHAAQQSAQPDQDRHMQACDDCSYCHLCGTASLPASPIIRADSPAPSALPDSVAQFYSPISPDLPYRPPRS